MYFSLKYLSKFNVRSEPLYKYKSFENGKYVMEVTVGNEEPVEGMCSEFLLEAEGGAAKAWLAKYQPNWKQILDSKPSSSEFSDGEGEVEMPCRDEEEEDVKLTPPSSPHLEAKESSSSKAKEVAKEKVRVKEGGFAVLDTLTRKEAFNDSDDQYAKFSPAFDLMRNKQREGTEWLGKGSGKTAAQERGRREKNKVRNEGIGGKEKSKRSVKGKEGEGTRNIREMLGRSVEKQMKKRQNSKCKDTTTLKEDVFGSISSADDADMEKQSPRGEKRKKVPSEEKSCQGKLSSDLVIGGKISPVKSVGKSMKLFGGTFDQSKKDGSSKKIFSFSSQKPLKELTKNNSNHKNELKEDSNCEPLNKTKRKEKEKDQFGEKVAFKFSSSDKKLKEEQVKKTGKKETKSRPPTKKMKKERSSSPKREVEATSGSSVFDHEDDPEVMEIVAKQQQEARSLSRRSRGGARGNQSLARMAERQMCQSKGTSSRTRRKLSESKAKKEDKRQPTIGKFFGASENKSNKETKEDNQDDDDAADLDPDYFTPNIDDLLKLPERPDDGSKTKEEILDELDVEIAKKHERHELDRAKVDRQIEEERKKKEERKARCKDNAKLRNRLEKELTEEKVRSMFRANIPHLKAIWNGQKTSKRHEAFHKSVRTRQALYYTMITDPFTDDQLDWVLEEMSSIWMRNKREQMENNEYIWKVLLPECFIKMYGDHFSFSKEEAEVRISETPLHKRDRAKLSVGEEEEDEEFTQTQEV